MAELNLMDLIQELAARYGIQLNANDPAVAIVMLNRLILEKSSNALSGAVAERLRQFEEAVLKVERRAGEMLADDVREAAAQIRAELQNDIEAAGMKAAHLVYMVDRAHKRPAIIRWLSAGLVSGMACLVWGFVWACTCDEGRTGPGKSTMRS